MMSVIELDQQRALSRVKSISNNFQIETILIIKPNRKCHKSQEMY